MEGDFKGRQTSTGRRHQRKTQARPSYSTFLSVLLGNFVQVVGSGNYHRLRFLQGTGKGKPMVEAIARPGLKSFPTLGSMCSRLCLALDPMWPKVRRLPEETNAERGLREVSHCLRHWAPSEPQVQCLGVDFHTQDMGAHRRTDRPLPRVGPCPEMTQANPDTFWRWCWMSHKVTVGAGCPQSVCACSLEPSRA